MYFRAMPRIILLLSLVLLLGSCRKSLYDSDRFTLKHDGERRSYLVHTPPSYSDAVSTSLIIALHGGVGSAKNIEEQSGLAEYADEAGFILCSPDGLNRTWNAGWCCGKAEKNGVDDVGFISALIDKMLDDYNISPDKVYVTGMSNGAFMSYRLACELSEKIAAIAPVAGTMNFGPCVPSTPVSIIHFHSFEDTSIPHLGGVGNGISDHYNSPIDSVLSALSDIYGCSSDTAYEIFEDVEYRSWSNCSDSVELKWFMSRDGGHSWPMGTKPTKKGDDPSSLMNANELMWEFFQAHPKG